MWVKGSNLRPTDPWDVDERSDIPRHHAPLVGLSERSAKHGVNILHRAWRKAAMAQVVYQALHPLRCEGDEWNLANGRGNMDPYELLVACVGLRSQGRLCRIFQPLREKLSQGLARRANWQPEIPIPTGGRQFARSLRSCPPV